eukprot:14709123-Alexandrium_andersonii.AAC.1
MRRAGAEMDLQRAVPELARWWQEAPSKWNARDAVLELRVGWPGWWLPTRWISVTVRDPGAERYAAGAAEAPGFAACGAAAEKHA